MAATDNFSAFADGLASPCKHGALVTPDNSTDLTVATRAVYVGGAGTLKVDFAGGETAVTFTGVTAGSILPIRVSRIYATGTSATYIIALW